MNLPKKPLTKEAKQYLQGKLERMDKIERDKTIKRLRTYDRGYVAKSNDDFLKA